MHAAIPRRPMRSGFSLLSALLAAAFALAAAPTGRAQAAPVVTALGSGSGGSTVTITTTTEVLAGESIIIAASNSDSAGTPLSLTCSDSINGSTYVAEGPLTTEGSLAAGACVKHASAALPSGTAITVQWASTPSPASVAVAVRVSGLAISPRDRAADATGISAAPATGASLLTRQASELLLGLFSVELDLAAAAFTPGANGTANVCATSGTTTATFVASADKGGSLPMVAITECIVSATGAYRASASLGASATWKAGMNAYKIDVAPPTLTASSGALAYTENGSAVAVDGALVAADTDSPVLTGATASITGNFQVGADVLAFTSQNGISGSFNAATGVLTMTGRANAAAYQAALRTVTYANTSEAPSTAPRTVSFQVTDGGSNASTVATRTIEVTAVNDAPTNSVPGAQATPGNTPLTFSTANGNAIGAADPDAGGADLQMTLSVGSGALTLGGTSGLSVSGNGTATVTATGPLAALNAGLQGLTFAPANGVSGTVVLTVTTSDLGNSGGGAQQDQDTVQIAVGALPVVAIDDPAGVAEGGAASSNVITFTVTLTPASNLTVSVPYSTTPLGATGGAACGGNVDYQSTSGTLTFAPGQTSKAVTVPICGDAVAEGDEQLRADLGTPVNAVLGKAQGIGTILNDDSACIPQVQVQATASGGALQVRLESRPVNGQVNPIHQVRFGTLRNGRVTMNGLSVATGQTVTVAGSSTVVTFTVQRDVPGQATTVPLTVVAGCGEWSTFVGGGTSAGF
jgi:hypothetical protein